MKVLFLGYAVSADIADSLSGISIAGNKMQVNVLKGLAAYNDIELKCITVYPVAPFPREKKAYIKAEEIKIAENITAKKIGFLNLPIIKQFCQTFSVYNTAKKIADKDTVVFAFNLFPQVGMPLVWLKKRFGCKTCSLLADLPIDDNKNAKNPIRNALRKLFDNMTVKAIKNCDSFVPLNEYAVKTYAPDKEYIVVEGGIEAEAVKKPDFDEKQNKNIIYSGALTDYSGVLNLIKAMEYVTDPNARLHIYGRGYLAEKIEATAENTWNVKYCGSVANKEMLRLQQEAFLLVNPRPIDDPISKVTFPSKIFEYMTSGTPVLTTRLNGIRNEYFEYLFLSDDNSPEKLAEQINTALKASPEALMQKAQDAYNFIITQKNWKVQCDKIYSFLKRQGKNG